MILLKILKKIFQKKFKNLGEALFNCRGGNDPKILKTEISDTKWKYSTKN